MSSSQAHTPTRSSFPVVVAILGILAIFWFLTSKVYLNPGDAAQTAPAPVDRPSLAEHRGKSAAALSGYKVIDAGAGKVRLPIDRAKELVLKENAK